MERVRPYGINHDFETTVAYWQRDPEDDRLAARLGSLIKEAGRRKGHFYLKIKGSTFRNSEGRRAMENSDLTRLAKKDGDNWIFHFLSNQNPNAAYRIIIRGANMENRGMVEKYNLVIQRKIDKDWGDVGIFAASEIDRIFVR